jgi:6-phosphogluconolactonase
VTREFRVLPDADALFASGAEEFARSAREAVGARGVFRVALSGGNTPRGLYARLAKDPHWRSTVPWSQIHFFWGDERHTPPDHPDSNYRMVRETLLDQVPVPADHVHRVHAEMPDAAAAADDYERTIRRVFRLTDGQRPRFDLVLLGLGPDSHTASLFPGSAALSEQTRLVVSIWVEKFRAERITMTLPVFNNAARVVFLVSGADKAPALRAVLDGPDEPDRFPAQAIRPESGSLLFLTDRAAAGPVASPGAV